MCILANSLARESEEIPLPAEANHVTLYRQFVASETPVSRQAGVAPIPLRR